MAMNRFDYSAPNQVRFQGVDPRLIEQAGTSAGSVAVGNILGEIEKSDALTREALIRKQAQADRDRLYGLKKTAADRAQTEYERKLAVDKALSSMIAKVPKTKEQLTKKTTKGTPGNIKEIERIRRENEAINQRLGITDTAMTEASEKYSDIYTKPASKKYVIENYPLMPKDSKRTYMEDMEGKRGSGFNWMFGNYDKARRVASAKEPARVMPDDYREQLHKQAMEESGLSGLISTREDLSSRLQSLPKLDKGVKDRIETISTSVNTTDIDKAKALRELLVKSELPGSVKIGALKNIKDIYPIPEKPTISEQLALAKDRRALVKDSKTLNDYKSIYAGIMPNSITTVDGAEAFSKNYENMLKRQGKKTSKFNLGEKMFTELTVKDVEDTDAVDAWLTKYDSQLAKMSTNEKKKLFAEMKARYAQEAGTIDLSDWIGGSAFGDITDKFQLK